jgi:hypothetical protein
VSLTTWIIIELALVGFFIYGYLLYKRNRKGGPPRK